MDIRITRDVCQEDVKKVGRNLRPADALEFLLATGRSAQRSFARSTLGAHDRHIAYLGDEPVAVFGLTLGPYTAHPWFMGTSAIEGRAAAKSMLTVGREVFRKWADEFGPLTNHAYAGNSVHLKYIKLLGAYIGPEVSHGALNGTFRQFTYFPKGDRHV